MVVMVSLSAAAALFLTFFGVIWVARRRQISRIVGSLSAAALAGFSWFLVVASAARLGWVRTEEAQFHHLYVLAVVGLPVVGLVLLILTLRRTPAGRDRRFGVGVAVAFMLPALGGVWATHLEPHWLRVDRQTIDVDAIGPGDRALRVAVIADIQTDVFGPYERSAIDAAMAEEPDVILVAGDLTQVNSTVFDRIRADGVALLSVLDAPGGVFVIDGNTDPSPEAVRQLALDAGASSLVDETAEVQLGDVRLRLGGLSWSNNRRPAGSAYLQEFSAGGSADTVDVLLAHSPDVVHNGAEWANVDLVVSGHTHGGQIALPFVGPLWNVTELPADVAAGGVHPVGDTTVYVSTGVGVGRGESPKIRFGVRPSIGILTLT